jgi:hypothetical protein
MTDDEEIPPTRKTRKAMVEDVDNDDDDMFVDTELEELPDDNSDDEDDMPDVAYNWMKAIGDADREVCHSSFLNSVLFSPTTPFSRLVRRHQKTTRLPTSE